MTESEKIIELKTEIFALSEKVGSQEQAIFFLVSGIIFVLVYAFRTSRKLNKLNSLFATHLDVTREIISVQSKHNNGVGDKLSDLKSHVDKL